MSKSVNLIQKDKYMCPFIDNKHIDIIFATDLSKYKSKISGLYLICDKLFYSISTELTEKDECLLTEDIVIESIISEFRKQNLKSDKSQEVIVDPTIFVFDRIIEDPEGKHELQ
jgi:hypothetical protein